MSTLLTRGLGGAVGWLLTRGLGSGGVAPPPPTPSSKNLVSAIVDRALATPEIADMLVGGITRGTAADTTPTPYASISDLGITDHLSTGTAYYREARYQISLFADSVDDLDTLGTKINDAFNLHMTPLIFADGTHAMVISGPFRYVGEGQDRNGQPLHHGYVELYTVHNRRFA